MIMCRTAASTRELDLFLTSWITDLIVTSPTYSITDLRVASSKYSITNLIVTSPKYSITDLVVTSPTYSITDLIVTSPEYSITDLIVTSPKYSIIDWVVASPNYLITDLIVASPKYLITDLIVTSPTYSITDLIVASPKYSNIRTVCHIFEISVSVPWLRRLVAALSPRSSGFDLRAHQMRYVVKKLALHWYGFVSVYLGFPPSEWFRQCRILVKHRRYVTLAINSVIK